MKSKWNNFKQKLKAINKPVQLSLTLTVIGLLFFLFTISNVYTETYEIARFSNASETIRSPLTIEDTRETERRRREALQSVEDRYIISNQVAEERVGYIEELFDALDTVNSQSSEQTELDGDPEEENFNRDNEGEIERSTEDKMQDLRQMLSSEILDGIDQETLVELKNTNENERTIVQELLTTTLFNLFTEGIRMEELDDAVEQMNQRFQFSTMSAESREILLELGEFALVPNSFFSVDQTVEAERQAMNNVEPAMIRAGEVIVREGQTITNELYDKLMLVGLLDSDRNVFPLIGLFILITVLTGAIAYVLIKHKQETPLDLKKLFALVLITFGTILIMKFISFFASQTNQLFFLVPIAASSMLLKLLYRDRIAIIFSIVFSIMAMIIFNGQIPGSLNLEAGVYMLFSQLSGIIFLVAIKDRAAIFRASMATAIVNMLIILAFLFLSYENYNSSDVFLLSGYGLSSAFISSIVTIGVLPFFESVLGILSDTKLLMLSSPNHPLLRKILMEAPGTYHHSVMVANLSEAACENIGANGLLARVASYYHDLGKTKQPHYFIENQMGQTNPHDYLDPKQSAEIIMAHPYEGARILRRHRLPTEIIDVAEQHHGTTLLKYFYYKEKEKNKEVKEKDYRYPGPRPQTKEAAVISICDSVEAAVRSMSEPTKEKIDQLITSIIQDRLTDGQFDDSDLTFRELEKIKVTISETLNGIYHSRIQYPTEDKEEA
ncbi:putative nucleotidyltransferase with HDIG domain [Natronobacillus azotifigens]|uniref:HDIG domain-containing protein n=1 Tax=Natronobacillus azotifigens TaxID=472978 RepID=A0A9J6RFB5_9BACI|nr:HDIG domain-containing metalloprotein [Natronobacillus azotifigens]MCZ0704027.1 HDIG domain-containing protein [Natronobacillus azotifigens]